MTPARSYRDVLAKRERMRPSGQPVWPLTDADFSSRSVDAATKQAHK